MATHTRRRLAAASAMLMLMVLGPCPARAQQPPVQPPLQPEEPPHWWLTVGGISAHDRARSADGHALQGLHPAVIVRRDWSPTWSAQGGLYVNSRRRLSATAGINALPLDLGRALGAAWRAGAGAGVVTGYDAARERGGALPYLLPMLEARWARTALTVTHVPATNRYRSAAATTVWLSVAL